MPRLLLLIIIAGLCLGALAAPVTLTLTVDGLERQALVYPGKDAAAVPSPLLLAFHGFGDSAENMAKYTRLHEAWPQATVVYPVGLPVFSQRRQKRVPAWQIAPGVAGDRDLHFTDALLDALANDFRVDPQRIYATGMSNGALFCYLLLTTRPARFAAFAPVAGAAPNIVAAATVPRPVLIIHGKNDSVVKPAYAEATRDRLRVLNGCGEQTVEWAPGYLSYQPCTSGLPIIWRLHDGGHGWPRDATNHIVRFCREQTLPPPPVAED